MIRVKICGITRKEDADIAINEGASALGFIFFRHSQRYIPPVKASNIVKNLPPFVDRVGVFVDMNLQGIINIIRKVGLSAVQLHGSEGPQFCYDLKHISSIPIIKAFRVSDRLSISQIDKYRHCANAILLDTYDSELKGGTGKTFSWELAKEAQHYGLPIILSGGLNSENVKEVYNYLTPYALDVNSGVEVAPGVKDHFKIKDFFNVIKALT